jgi:hypothetical protein
MIPYFKKNVFNKIHEYEQKSWCFSTEKENE